MWHGWRMICLVLALVEAGCSSHPATIGLQGEVSYEGRTVKEGQIEFEPTDGTKGATSAANIVNGRYETSSQWGILPNGVYLVRIVGYRKTGKTERVRGMSGDPPVENAVKENFIPAIHNSLSTLKVRIADLPDKNRVDFRLGKTPNAASD